MKGERRMEERRGRPYFRLGRAERAAIERGLDGRESGRGIARSLGRSNATVSDEVRRNRTVAKGPGKGGRVEGVPEDACPRLLRWPWVCNGCRYRRYHCTRKWRCEYSAARAQALADGLLSEARRGVNAREADFEAMMAAVRADVARGLSPAQIAEARKGQFEVSASTLYRWIGRGYAGMSNMDLRRKVGYKPRRAASPARPTPHGPGRSHAAFLALPEEERAAACEMDCVMGRARDGQCLLTLYHRPSKIQLALLLPERSREAVAGTLGMLERALGGEAFGRLFGLVLTDNGAEFSDFEALERSALPGGAARCRVFYCDVRQSQQKAGCERNHVELRKLLPKGRGISFDALDGRDCAELMSQLNSMPRPSLMGLSPFSMLGAAMPEEAGALFDALGVREVPYGELDLTPNALNRARAERGLPPIC